MVRCDVTFCIAKQIGNRMNLRQPFRSPCEILLKIKAWEEENKMKLGRFSNLKEKENSINICVFNRRWRIENKILDAKLLIENILYLIKYINCSPKNDWQLPKVRHFLFIVAKLDSIPWTTDDLLSTTKRDLKHNWVCFQIKNKQ